MIQIKHIHLDGLAVKYYGKLDDFINQKNTKYDLNKINRELIRIFGKNLKQIVISRPDDIRDLIKLAPKSFSTDIEALKDLYKTFRDKWGVELINDLDIEVCPFCNREYIFKFKDSIKSKKRIIATLDHYYDKDTYPFLAVSFFNIIPSCHICNSKFKHTINFYITQHLHPYEDDFNTKAKFTHFFKDKNEENKSDALFSKKRIALNIDSIDKNDQKTKNTIETFRLQDLYSEHKEIILELIQKREIYSDSYIDELFKQYEGTLFKNREDLLRLITCGYVSDEDLGKRPLSKLIKDISKELEFL